jgi:hypothetical protein
MPTNLSIADPDAFRRLARSLAAEGGVELSSDRPVATVAVERPVDGRDGGSVPSDEAGRTRTLECSISLPAAAGTGAHISITAERAAPPSPIELVDRGVLGPELVAAIWTVLAETGSVVFVGPARAEPIAALAAHAPFVPPETRPVSLPGTERAVTVPHETGVTIGREAVPQDDRTAVGDRAGLDPGMVLLAGIGAPEPMRRFGSVLAAGRGSLAAARTADRGFFVDAATSAGLSGRTLRTVDLLVELPGRATSEPATGWIPTGESPPGDARGTVPPVQGQETAPAAVEWTQVFGSGRCGEEGGAAMGVEQLADRDDSFEPADLERRRQYVEYLQAESMTDRAALLGFLADMRTDEAATVERIQRTLS